MLHCVVLYCILLYCIVLYCIVLYCIVLCAPMFAESVYRVNTTNKLEQYGSRKALQRDY